MHAYFARTAEMPVAERKAEGRARRARAEPVLRAMLRAGDRVRGVKTVCGAREATYTFSHWDGPWMVTRDGSFLTACCIRSVNRQVLSL